MDDERRRVIQRVRAAISRLRREETHIAATPSRMWRENVDAFRYLLEDDDLTPFDKLRRHTHHITGEPGRKLPRIIPASVSLRDRFAELGERFGLIDSRTERAIHFRTWLCTARPSPSLVEAVSEPPLLGGDEITSCVISGRLYNFETSRFLVELVNIEEWGVIQFERPGLRILDIGGGWGGLAFFLRRVLPDSHITIIDLPETFIFSIPYLMFVDSGRRFYFPDESDGLADPTAAEASDYSFYSPAALARFPNRSFDLIINTGSMAEMTEEQVWYYLKQIKRVGRGAFYSFNEDRQARNSELDNLTSILKREFSTVIGRHTFVPFRSIGCTW